ncbi:MAG: OmpA family protein, partial [Paracoccaceae bacterium]
SPAATLSLATGPWTPATGTPLRAIDGPLDHTADRLAGPLTTLEILTPLRDQLIADGYTLVYECEASRCGGFDFRYDLAVLPEPDMHVDLADYRYLAATRLRPTGTEAISLIISRSANAGFVQLSRIGSLSGTPAPTLSTMAPTVPIPQPAIAPAAPLSDIGQRLESGGAFALDDLAFAPGAATLAPGDYASLAALAAYLQTNPNRSIAIVGHTDASGSLDANIALSRRRAASVRSTLIDQLGAPAARIIAEGVGYLVPRATNLTDEGRAANRRVEVMLTSTE